MKKITKILASLALVAGFSTAARAQDSAQTGMMNSNMGKKFNVGVGVSGGLTTKSSPFDYTVGADLLLQWNLMENVALTASGGYVRFMAKDGAGVDAVGYIPAVGGVKVYPGIGRMYLAGNLGAGIAIEDGQKTCFVFGGGTGYDWNNGLTVGVRYEGWKQDSSASTYVPAKASGQFALRIGYNFL